ncbi:MAG: protein translocase subunit SecF [Actinomycetaceae bacterium]|nr:protein translocase subunit SecF [Actinomycetaceae bacterium]
MMSFAAWGNALYHGEKSYGFIERRKLWISVGLGLIVLAMALVGIRGINPSIEFSGGSQFSVVNTTITDQQRAYDVMSKFGASNDTVRVSQLGTSGIRVQTAQVDPNETRDISNALAQAYEVESQDVDATNIGPSWGGEVTRKAANSLVIFLVLVGLMMTIYFKSWEMSVAALFALFHDIFLTAGFFALVQVEVSPATVIGFLTILAYSLYDTVVVFDRVRELTSSVTAQARYTFGELVNLAVNQTLVRSINTSVVALLPVGAILFLGSILLGAGTLTDISLALFVGMIAGTLSSILIAPSMLVVLRNRSKKISAHTARVLSQREGKTQTSADKKHERKGGKVKGAGNRKEPALADTAKTKKTDTETSIRVQNPTPGRHLGQAAQPRRKNRKKKR